MNPNLKNEWPLVVTQSLLQHLKQWAGPLTGLKLSAFFFETLQVTSAVLGWWITDQEAKSLAANSITPKT